MCSGLGESKQDIALWVLKHVVVVVVVVPYDNIHIGTGNARHVVLLEVIIYYHVTIF